MVSQLSDKVVDVRGESAAAGASVIMYDRKTPPSLNQLWYEDESGIIRSKLNGFVLDASNGRNINSGSLWFVCSIFGCFVVFYNEYIFLIYLPPVET